MLHSYLNNPALRPHFVARRAALMALFIALMMGCGADIDSNDHGGISGENNRVDSGKSPDANSFDDASSDIGVPDVRSEDDASESADTAGEFDVSSDYQPDLDAVVPSPEDCPTAHMGPDITGPLGARVFVPSYRLDFDALSTHQSYREHIHQLIYTQVLPCMPAEGPTLVLFPEAMSLPMLLIGRKAAAARQMQDSASALSAMIAALPEANAYYAEKYPAASTNSRFMLALTDPLVRATYDTFAQLANRYNIYISVSATLPEFSRVVDPAEVARLADPDITSPQYAYRADGLELYSRQLLFGPDGELHDATLKPYLSQMGRAQLGLSDAHFGSLHTFESPWGASAVAQSDAALMPDVQDRLDDLGARVVLQPTAHSGGWATAEPWQPDRFMLGAYNLVQRSPRIARSYASQLTGNFFEVLFDAQIQMVADADTHPEGQAFIGQASAAPGTIFVGPWVVEDPRIAHPEWSVEEGRAHLQETGARLAPGASEPLEAGTVEGIWSNDLPAPDPTGTVATHPALAAMPERLYLTTSHGIVGARGLRMQVLSPDSDAPEALADFRVSLPGFDIIRPTMAVGESRVHIVAEAVADNENRLIYAVYDTQTQHFSGTPLIIDTQFVGTHAYHPDIAVSGDVLNMTWVQQVNGVNRAFFAQTSLSAPFENLSVRTEIARRGEEPMTNPGAVHSDADRQAPESHWDVRLAVTPSAIAVSWLNYRASSWELLVSASVDGGLSWSRALRVDSAPESVQAFNATPTLKALEGRRFAIAWTDARASRPETRIGVATLTVTSNGAVSAARPSELLEMDAPTGVSPDDSAQPSRWFWRPTLLTEAGGLSVYYEALIGGQRSIQRTRIDAEGTPLHSESVAAAGYFPSVAATNNGVFLAYERLYSFDAITSEIRTMRITPASAAD